VPVVRHGCPRCLAQLSASHVGIPMPRHPKLVSTFSSVSRARAERAARQSARDPTKRCTQACGATDGLVRRGGRKHPRDTHRNRAGSSALAPAAHGGLPPESYPGHCPSPVGHRHVRPAHSCGNGHPPGAPVLSRPRSPSRALQPAASASRAMALRATLDCDLPRIDPAPIRRMAKTGCQGSKHAPGTIADLYAAASYC
jgi:hypothetical protein